MTIEDDIAFLETVPILPPLGAARALRILAIGAESYRVQAGQVLFTAGEIADCAYVVQRARSPRAGAAARAARSLPGRARLLGETALLTETLRPVTATARENSAVMRISRAMFLKMLESYPDAAQRLRELIAARAEQMGERNRRASAPRCRASNTLIWRSQLDRRRHRHMVGRPHRAAIVSWRWRSCRRGRRAAAKSRRDRAGGRGRRSPVRRAIAPPGIELGRLRRQFAHAVDPAAGACAPRSSFSHSIGVCDTTRSICLWLQTSCSSGATLRSPTRMARSDAAGRSDPRARASRRGRRAYGRISD